MQLGMSALGQKRTSAKSHLLILSAQKKDRLVAFPVGTSAVQSELTIMTYQSDTRRDKRDDKFYTSWIIRGGIVLAIVIAVLAFISTGTYPDLDAPQITTTDPGPAS